MLPNNKKNRGWIYATCIFFILFFIPIWIVFIAPEFKKIPKNFSYAADVLSLDNFYDEVSGKFEGAQISKTIFKYDIVEKTPLFFVIKNLFDVRRRDDVPIFYVERLYYIDPYQWQHVLGIKEKNRFGYLFGPRYANKNEFYYWHVNYDAPALLKFVKEEKLDHLTVYQYAGNYEADQTVNLAHLPSVPETRGIRTNVNLNLWIEPISGWLVKYQDNTLAYYYDQKTGKEIAPWNQFSNRYTQSSLHQQVQMAKKMKWKILMVDFGVPIGLLMIAVLFGLKRYPIPIHFTFFSSLINRMKTKKYIYIYLFFILIIGIGGSEVAYYFFWQVKTKTIYTIGIVNWNNNPELHDVINGFKEGLKEYGFYGGKNIRYIEMSSANIEKQINAVQSYVDAKVDLIFTLTTPATLVAKGVTQHIPIVFSAVTYPEQAGMVDSLRSSKNNLAGVRNYIPPAQQFYMFSKLYPNIKTFGFFYRRGDSNSAIQYQEYKKMLSKQGVEVMEIAVIDLDDLHQKLQQANNYDALYIACDTLLQQGGKIISSFGRDQKIPVLSCSKDNVINGALMGYVADPYKLGKLAGIKAALILRGAEPKWLHIDSLDRGSLIINLGTAKILEVSIPQEILQQADYIIEK